METLGAHGQESKAAATSHAKAIVFVVDDDISVRESLQMLIQSAGWRPVLFGSAQEFLAQPRVMSPSCLILDVSLPGLNGFDLQRRVADRTDMPIIFITGHGDVPMSVRAMKAGAAEFLTKPFTDESLLQAITHAIARSHAVVSQESQLKSLRTRYESLSHREQQVLALIVAGLLNKQVGAQLNIQETTVKAHRGMLMRKMQARTFVDLVNMAARLGVGKEA
jgi:FixJ family two-component response regulator